jgi:hypothetical protein
MNTTAKFLLCAPLFIIGCTTPNPVIEKDCFGVDLKESAYKMANFENDSTTRMVSDNFLLRMNIKVYQNRYPYLHQDRKSDIISCKDLVVRREVVK